MMDPAYNEGQPHAAEKSVKDENDDGEHCKIECFSQFNASEILCITVARPISFKLKKK